MEAGKTDIVLFMPVVSFYNRPCKIDEKYTNYPVFGASGSFAYLINRQAAAVLLKDNRSSLIADDFMKIRQLGIRIKSIYPNIVKVLEKGYFPSCIGSVRNILLPEKSFPFHIKVKKIIEWEYIKILLKRERLIDKRYFKGDESSK